MNFFQRPLASIDSAKPIDNMVKAYSEDAFTPAEGLSPYPSKVLLAHCGVFAYRTEFMVSNADAALVIEVLESEFDLQGQDFLHQGEARSGKKAIHYSFRPDFGGAIVMLVTNSASLLSKIDALRLAPPPPWIVFPDADAATLGSLQGAMEYWWDWLFLPFWSAADAPARLRYLKMYPTNDNWLEFLQTHAS